MDGFFLKAGGFCGKWNVTFERHEEAREIALKMKENGKELGLGG